jgi:hypothetical protein
MRTMCRKQSIQGVKHMKSTMWAYFKDSTCLKHSYFPADIKSTDILNSEIQASLNSFKGLICQDVE